MKKIIMILLCCFAVAAQAENVVSVSSASGHPQDEVTFNVSLANADAPVAFQAEIPLGSQLTYVAGSVTLNPDRVTDHQVTAAVVNNNLRIFVYSLSLTPFVGNEGNLLCFTLKLKNEPGDYLIDISQTKLSEVSGTALPLTTQSGTATILSPKLSINTPAINYGHVPIRSEYTQTAQVSNVGNELLTISSISFSDAAFSCPNFTETTLQPGTSTNFTFKFAPMLKGAVNAVATIASNSISGNGIINLVADSYAVNEIHVGNVMGYCDSIVELAINMNNMEDIIGFQLEFNLITALEFVDFSLSDRKTDHVATGVVSGTTLRLMAYSTSGSAFTGEDGVLGTVRFRLHGLYGSYNLNPTKAVLADANGEDALSDKYQGYVTIRSPRINGNNSLSFGSSPVTETVTKEYVVSNNGNAPMRIDQVVFDQEGFAVTEILPITVDEWGSVVLHVSYCREQKGDFNAIMKIYSNDPQNGLKNVSLSGHRYEPNSVSLAAEPLGSMDDNVVVTINLDNYSGIVAFQADFNYPYQDYSMSPADFQLTDRFENHSLYVIQTNDSTYRVLALSMQNTAVEGHDGAVLNVTMHPIGTPSWEPEYEVGLSNIVLSGVEGMNQFTGEDANATFTFMASQSSAFALGWNWWSSSIELSAIDGLSILEDALGDNGIIIKTSNQFVQNMDWSEGWMGSLAALTNERCYKIQTSAECAMTMRGPVAHPADHPITIQPEWNWIGYPVAHAQNVASALEGFQPSANDIIKGQNGYATYIPSLGWLPEFTLEPGKGYLYHSNNENTQTLVYSINRGDVPEDTDDALFWHGNVHGYSDNLCLLAVVSVDGEEMRTENLELGAFVGDECRGSARLMYVKPFDRYFAVMTVSGEDGDEVYFKLMDMSDQSVRRSSSLPMVFSNNAVVGLFSEPYVAAFAGHASSEENDASLVLYPNPVNCGESVRLLVPEDETVVEWTVFDALGAAVQHKAGAFDSHTVEGLPVSGIYLVKVVCRSGNTYHHRLIVK